MVPIFNRRKYVLYCKDSEESKEWEPIAEFDKPIGVAEARSYGEDCYQLRLEERTKDGDKRIRVVWVERKSRKRKEAGLSDLIAQAGLLGRLLGEVNKTYFESFKDTIDAVKMFAGSGGSSNYTFKDIIDFAKALAVLASTFQGKGLSLNQLLNVLSTAQSIQQQAQSSTTNVKPEVVERLMEEASETTEELIKTPCTAEECLEKEGGS